MHFTKTSQCVLVLQKEISSLKITMVVAAEKRKRKSHLFRFIGTFCSSQPSPPSINSFSFFNFFLSSTFFFKVDCMCIRAYEIGVDKKWSFDALFPPPPAKMIFFHLSIFQFLLSSNPPVLKTLPYFLPTNIFNLEWLASKKNLQ